MFIKILIFRSDCFSTAPFTHESLLVDHKEKKLSRAEKKMALRNFEYERSAKSGYARASYAAFYPKQEVPDPAVKVSLVISFISAFVLSRFHFI
jgi:hypothetical protein